MKTRLLTGLIASLLLVRLAGGVSGPATGKASDQTFLL